MPPIENKLINTWTKNHPYSFYLIISLFAAFIYTQIYHYVGGDLEKYVLLWMDHIQNNDRWAALKDAFHQYSGPYLILLTLFSYLDGILTNHQIIKLISVFGLFATAIVFYLLISKHGNNRVSVPLLASSFLFVPTIITNAVIWGQVDIYYSGLVLLSFLFLLKDKIVIAIAVFGAAISFKLQAIFFAPFLLMFIIMRGRSVLLLLIIPLIYFLLNTPLLLAGRDFQDVATIYFQQSKFLDLLAVNSPNPWFWVYGALNNYPALYDSLYPYLTILGLLLTFLAGLAIAGIGLLRDKLSAYQNILVATLCLGLMPYLLPKMHDRYFFPADIFSFALIAFNARLWPIALTFQLGSGFAYIPYFFHGHASQWIIVAGPAIGSLFISAGLLALTLIVAVELGKSDALWRQKLENRLKKLGYFPQR